MDRPSRRVAERTDGVTFNLFGHVPKHVDLFNRCIALNQTFHHAHHPTGAFAARGALTAGFVLVELGQTPDRFHDVDRLIHDDHRRSTEARAQFTAQVIEVHDRVFHLFAANAGNRRTTRNYGKQVIPAATDATAVLFDQFFERDAHLFFNNTWVVHVTRDREQLGAHVVRATHAREPRRTTTQDGRANSNRFDVVHGGRATVEARTSRERRLHTRHAFFAFKAFEQRGFFTTDISACTVVQIKIEVPARASSILTQKASVISFVDRSLQSFAFADIFATDVDVAGMCIHCERRDQAAFDQRVRIVAHDFAVFTGARL